VRVVEKQYSHVIPEADDALSFLEGDWQTDINSS
jgi:hypothetical protein